MSRLLAVLGALALAGCLGVGDTLDPAAVGDDITAVADVPMKAPDMTYYAVEAPGVETARAAELNPGYHELEEVYAKIADLAVAYPDVVELVDIGVSNDDRPLTAIVLGRGDGKPVAFIDGGHHANEYEGIESTIFLADFLAANAQTNATVRGILERTEIWMVPLVNPDGYVEQSRANGRDVNLNRNYDFAWCAEGAANHCDDFPVDGMNQGEYAGPEPFSEPETRAIRDATLAVGDRLAYYMSLHTAAYCITSPWTAPEPPYEVPAAHRAVFDEVFAWVDGNTEFGAGGWHGDGGECMNYWAGGTSMDWAYDTFQVPTFTMETGGYASPDGRFAGFSLTAGMRDLEHWVWATIPIHLYMLQNVEALKAWETGLDDPAPTPGA